MCYTANRISTKFGDQIWVTKESSRVVQNFRICTLAGRKYRYYKYHPVSQEQMVTTTLNSMEIIAIWG